LCGQGTPQAIIEIQPVPGGVEQENSCVRAKKQGFNPIFWLRLALFLFNYRRVSEFTLTRPSKMGVVDLPCKHG